MLLLATRHSSLVTSSRRAFTLLEITLAVAILGMMSLAIYRFVETNLTTLRISSNESENDARYTGFVNLLTTQWQSLPTGAGAMVGEPLKQNDVERDEVTWVCGSGPGMLTRYAAGEFSVNMRLRPSKAGSARMEIGLVRIPLGESGPGDETWVPLLDGVTSLQIRYFDPRLNTWVERWSDTMTLPRLVRLIIGRPDRSVPWEAIIALGRTPL